jgi:hypothetical protein
LVAPSSDRKKLYLEGLKKFWALRCDFLDGVGRSHPYDWVIARETRKYVAKMRGASEDPIDNFIRPAD